MGPGREPLETLASSSSDSFRFTKLNGSNYVIWCQHMKASLQSRYLWLIVSGDETKPTEPAKTAPTAKEELTAWKTDKKEHLDWLQKDQAAQGLMKGASDSTQWPHVAKSNTAKEMWEAWEKLYVTNQKSMNVHYWFEDLYTRKYDESKPMADHIAAMLDLGEKITGAGETLPDAHVARALVLSLPRTQTWELVKTLLFSKETLTSEIVSTELTAHANRAEREKKTETALFASKKEKGKGKPSRGKPKPEDVCRKCGRKGHWANRCPDNDNNDDEKEKKGGGGSANLATTRRLRDLGSREVGQVFMTRRSTDPARSDKPLYADSAASSHMFPDRHYFISYTKSTEAETISVGDDHQIPIAGRGSIRFRSKLPDGFRTVTLHSVLHVPDLAANLISVGTLQKAGCGIRSYDKGLSILEGNNSSVELFRAPLSGSTGTLYTVDILTQEDSA